ncbi:MAG TPA: patatin-like phospholipase family protein, partial [Plasticicumulans sp.]|nr:patatin-like phospholipase family protein [Plasticicumulans sp.]
MNEALDGPLNEAVNLPAVTAGPAKLVRRAPGEPIVGLALGSGSARGWAHIGVLRALAALGIEPQIVTGCSVGALVAAAWASGRLDALEAWVRRLDWWQMLNFVDLGPGALIAGERLRTACIEHIGEHDIETLPVRFGCVATDLARGREVWFQSGSLLDAVRASMALPGVFPPVRGEDGAWLVDGGLVDPVPVSLARALG